AVHLKHNIMYLEASLVRRSIVIDSGDFRTMRVFQLQFGGAFTVNVTNVYAEIALRTVCEICGRIVKTGYGLRRNLVSAYCKRCGGWRNYRESQPQKVFHGYASISGPSCIVGLSRY